MSGERLYTDFDSIDSVLSVVDQPLPEGSGQSSVNHQETEVWDLSLGWKGAMSCYTGGWAEGASKALELADTLAPKPMASRTTLQRSVVGAFPNVGAHLAGAPNAMYRVSSKQATGRPYVHLWAPISYSARVEAETAFNRGCAIVAVVDALESAGCRVKVTLVRSSTVDESDRLYMRFMVKDYGDPLDIDQLMFTAAHPAFFRRIAFALQERSEHATARSATRSGYGSPIGIDAEDCPEDGNEVRVILPHLEAQGGNGTPESYLRQMVECLPDDVRTEIEGE
jgi:hypothetical protein